MFHCQGTKCNNGCVIYGAGIIQDTANDLLDLCDTVTIKFWGHIYFACVLGSFAIFLWRGMMWASLLALGLLVVEMCKEFFDIVCREDVYISKGVVP